MDEVALGGGRVTSAVVRVGNTVRRPTNDRSPFVHDLLRRLERAGFDAAPRFLGIDERGREILSFLDGEPKPGTAILTDDAIGSAARLLRRFHEAAPGVVHGDPGPWNVLWRGDIALALIDFDEARPGDVQEDLGYVVWKALRLVPEGPPVEVQRRRLALLEGAYGTAVDVDAIAAAVDRMHAKGVRECWPDEALERIELEARFVRANARYLR